MSLRIRLETLAPPVFLACMAVALQIQITLFSSPDYIGLRLSLADLVLPFAGIFVLWSLMRGQSNWPVWKHPFGYWAVAILVTIMVMGLLNGWLISGEISRWALVNKVSGWLILMAYLGLGGWIAANAQNSADNELKKFFLVPLVAVFLAILVFNMALSSTYALAFENLASIRQYRLTGLMANRNSYAFFYLFVVTAVTVFSSSGRDKSVFGWLAALIWFLLPVTAFLNLSRTLWLCLPLLFTALAFLNPRKVLKVFLPLLLIGSLLIPALFTHRMTKKSFQVYRNTEWLVSYAQDPDDALNQKQIDNSGDGKRLAILKSALEMIKERPFLGSGLGAVLNDPENPLIVLDNSPLWIATEMGLVGLAGFLAVYICMIMALRRGLLQEKRESGEYALSLIALILLLTFGIFSLFHEILYSRFMWFVLGLALAVWRAQPQKNQEPLPHPSTVS